MNKSETGTLRRKIIHIYRSVSQIRLLRLISESLENLLPIFLISAFIQVLVNFPSVKYQEFITSIAYGNVISLFRFIEFATYGMLSLYMNISVADSVNHAYGKASHRLTVITTSLASFLILSGVFNTSSTFFNMDLLGPKNMLAAIFCGLFSSFIYIRLLTRFVFSNRRYVEGISMDFTTVLVSLLPITIVLFIFALLDGIIIRLGFTSFYEMLTEWFSSMFEGIKNSLTSVIRYQFIQNLLWMFGIHGSDALGEIKYRIFDAVLDPSKAGRNVPIINGVFIDIFVLLGGCGSTWSLLIALLLFSRQRNEKYLARASMLPMIFNINELLIMGLPVVFNPVFLIPFLLTPVVNVLISYFAFSTGLVPPPVHVVNWTTPILLGGYLATGSPLGALLQVVCTAAGVCIYMPFVKINSRIKVINSHEQVKMLENILKECEESREPVEFLTFPGDPGRIARTLALELGDYIDSDDFTIYYQPQYNDAHKLIGAEALLRWRHDQYGPVYPPLAIALAEEIGRLTELEEKIFLTVFKNLDELLKYKEDDNFHISINVTGITIQTDEFEDFLKNLHIIYPGKCKHVLIEITEQATLKVDDTFISRLQRIKALGYTFGIDDFSMGNTSIKYLQSSIFDIVKLDGGISRDIFNERSREIISSISRLTEGFNIETVAEYVETEEQRKALEDVGCYIYQGYLYSPAIPLSKFSELSSKGLEEIAAETKAEEENRS